MKKILINAWVLGLFIVAACSNKDSKKSEASKDMGNMSKDSTGPVTQTVDKEIKAVAVSFNTLDAKIAVSIKEIVDHYLHLKNALANDNGSEAASAGKAMEKTIGGVDKSFFTAEQKKVYDNIEDDLKEHAEHIGKNGDNITHQREHFAMMSEDVYDLVKAFGGGRPIYHDHCPMYNEGKGALWLSEMKEVKNPYFGAKMPTCGSVEEIIK